MALRLLVILALVLQSVLVGPMSACAARACSLPPAQAGCCCDQPGEDPGECCCRADQRPRAPIPAAPASFAAERGVYIPAAPVELTSWPALQRSFPRPGQAGVTLALTTPGRLALLCLWTT